MRVCCVDAHALDVCSSHESQKKASHLELQTAMVPTWVLGIGVRFSAEAASSLTHGANSPHGQEQRMGDLLESCSPGFNFL